MVIPVGTLKKRPCNPDGTPSGPSTLCRKYRSEHLSMTRVPPPNRDYRIPCSVEEEGVVLYLVRCSPANASRCRPVTSEYVRARAKWSFVAAGVLSVFVISTRVPTSRVYTPNACARPYRPRENDVPVQRRPVQSKIIIGRSIMSSTKIKLCVRRVQSRERR